jgi:hypothetical protein
VNNSKNTSNDIIAIDKDIEEMRNHPTDYSDIPPAKPGRKIRLVYKEFLDMLPKDIVQELVRRRLTELTGERVK